MPNISDILERLKANGLTVSVTEDGMLEISPSNKVTPELRALLVQHKPALIAHIRSLAGLMECEPHWQWQMVFADGSSRIAAFVPPATWQEVKACYPQASTGCPILDNDPAEWGGKHGPTST